MSDDQGQQTFEMQWDCSVCGTTKLLGKTHRFCPNCGSAQNPDARYFPSDDEKVAVHDHVFVGTDVTCDTCGTLNGGNSEFCQNCSAPLTDAARATRREDQSRAAGEAFESDGPRDLVKEKFDAEMERVGVKPKRKEGINKKVVAIIGVIALAVIGVIVALTWTQEATVYASGHTWERTINVEEYQRFTEQSWRDVRPAGDDVVQGGCTTRQRSTRQVADGQECRTVRSDNGDGTFSERQSCTTKYRSEPVYDDWCTFTGKRWESSYSRDTSGEGLDEAPYWPQLSLNCENQRSLGCEKATRDETYWVEFTGDEKREYRCPFSQNEWESVPIESVWTVQVRVVDADAADCGTLKRGAG